MSNKFNFIKTLRFKILLLSSIGMMVFLVTTLLYVLPLYERSFVESQEDQVRAAVDLAYSVIESNARKVEDKTLTLEQAQESAKNMLRPMRYNNTDYFFTYDFDGKVIEHGLDASMEGKDRLDSKDPVTGKLYVREMVDLAKGEGHGFVHYFFPKVKGGAYIPKVSYIRAYQPWKWYVGSGLYQDVVLAKVHDFESKVLIGFSVVFVMVLTLAGLFGVSLARKIQNIVGALGGYAGEVVKSVQVVEGAGTGLSNSSTEAAASLEETVASLEEVTSMIKSNSDSAQQAASISLSSREAALKGEEELRRLTESMNEISHSSKKIEEIIHVIDDIAFQTNLLALNAAVEAARAGEQGKGFAVVAEAVRSLAQRSATAAKDIAVLIKDSVHKVEGGTHAADASAQALQKIMEAVKKVSDLNAEIAAASTEQTTGIQQISSAMNQLDQVSQANAAASEEISSNVIEISDRIKEVNRKVSELQSIVDGNKAA